MKIWWSHPTGGWIPTVEVVFAIQTCSHCNISFWWRWLCDAQLPLQSMPLQSYGLGFVLQNWAGGRCQSRRRSIPFIVQCFFPPKDFRGCHQSQWKASSKHIARSSHCSIESKDRVLQVLWVCFYGLQRAIEILDNSGLLLSKKDSKEAAESLQLHLVSYSWLAAMSWNEGQLLFRFRPKHHYLFHQACQLQEWRLNQSVFHTWEQESFLGKVKQICNKCHGSTATIRVFERYLLTMAMMLEQHRRLQPEPWMLLFANGYRYISWSPRLY